MENTEEIGFIHDSSCFELFRENNIFFYDFTRFIKQIDKLFRTSRIILLFRNRRMGKSLFLDCLDFYYNLNFKKDFDTNFENLEVQKYQSSLKNSMIVLRLDFSTININNFEDFDKDLNLKINNSIGLMTKKSENLSKFIREKDCTITLENLAEEIQSINSSLLILIDEYDSSITRFFNQSNEMEKLKYKNNNESEKAMTSFRRFFATLKLISNSKKIYIFITGVSPQSLSDFTSGFNVGTDISGRSEFSEILGYPETTVTEGLHKLKIPKEFFEPVLNKLRKDNNGYRYAYEEKINSVYNPSKINYCFQNMQINLRKDNVKKAIHEKNLEEFMKCLFRFPENSNTRPAESTLRSLCAIKKADEIIFKILNNSNQLNLNYRITGPHSSYWDFEEECQLISYLYYCGALTYAPFSEGNHECSVIIPNQCAEKEYFDKLREKINSTTKDTIKNALNKLFTDDDITLLVNEIDNFFKENSKTPDIVQSKEDGMEWSIFILLKICLQDQIVRQMDLKQYPNDFKTFYDDLVIFPSSHPNKIFAIELKNIPFLSLTVGLTKYFKDTNQNFPDLMQKSWDKLAAVYKEIVYDKNLLTENVLSTIEFQYYDVEEKKNVTKSYEKFLQMAKKQIIGYAKMISEKPENQGKEIIKFVIVRCGPSKIFGYKVE